MTTPPYMPLYVSDFLGDTLHLSTELVGAYALLLMAMWNAGGSLPDDEAKLARVTRFSLKKWRGAAPDLMEFFEVSEGLITHRRLTHELRKSESKSQSRAAAGELGARAKALKDKERNLANATALLKQPSQTSLDKPSAQQQGAAPPAALPKDWLDQALDANGMGSGFREERNIGLLSPAPFIGLIAAGFDWHRDILPGIRSKPNAAARTWGYFEGQIRDFVARRDRVAAVPKAPERRIDWAARMRVWREGGTWAVSWGPRPGERGCMAPSEGSDAAA